MDEHDSELDGELDKKKLYSELERNSMVSSMECSMGEHKQEYELTMCERYFGNSEEKLAL